VQQAKIPRRQESKIKLAVMAAAFALVVILITARRLDEQALQGSKV